MSQITTFEVNDKSFNRMNIIANSKSKPYLGKGEMDVGVSIDIRTGEVDMILPRGCAPDTVGYNTNKKNQIEAKEKMKVRLLKKLEQRKSQKN